MEDEHHSIFEHKEVYWVAATLLTALIITGLLFRFNYSDAIQVPLHDAYVEVGPMQFTGVFWVALTFVIFLVGSFKERFGNIGGIYVLLVANSVLTVLSIVFAYLSYIFYTANPTSGPFEKVMIFWGIMIGLFSLSEVLVARRLGRLRRQQTF